MKAQQVFEDMTAKLVADIEKGAGTWRMPWHCIAEQGSPVSCDGRGYRGSNALWLSMLAMDRGWESGTWGTYKAWERKGGQVRKGEKSAAVTLWKPVENVKEDGSKGKGLIAIAYHVFAAEQVEGSDEIVARRSQVRDSFEQLEAAEQYFAAIGAEVQHGGNRACYSPTADKILLPNREAFDRPEMYYSTRAHESTHWTGHKDRLARDLSGRFGSDAYACEELVAELGAAFWSAQSGISQATRQDHAAYLANWLKVLRENPRAIVTFASKAQQAVDHLNVLAGWTSTVREPIGADA